MNDQPYPDEMFDEDLRDERQQIDQNFPHLWAEQ